MSVRHGPEDRRNQSHDQHGCRECVGINVSGRQHDLCHPEAEIAGINVHADDRIGEIVHLPGEDLVPPGFRPGQTHSRSISEVDAQGLTPLQWFEVSLQILWCRCPRFAPEEYGAGPPKSCFGKCRTNLWLEPPKLAGDPDVAANRLKML